MNMTNKHGDILIRLLAALWNFHSSSRTKSLIRLFNSLPPISANRTGRISMHLWLLLGQLLAAPTKPFFPKLLFRRWPISFIFLRTQVVALEKSLHGWCAEFARTMLTCWTRIISWLTSCLAYRKHYRTNPRFPAIAAQRLSYWPKQMNLSQTMCKILLWLNTMETLLNSLWSMPIDRRPAWIFRLSVLEPWLLWSRIVPLRQIALLTSSWLRFWKCLNEALTLNFITPKKRCRFKTLCVVCSKWFSSRWVRLIWLTSPSAPTSSRS